MKRKTFISVLSFLSLLAIFIMLSCKKDIQELTNYKAHSGYASSALRKGQSDPEVQRIRDDLRTLAMGLIEISADISIKNLVYQNIRTGEITDTLAKYYFVSLDTLFAKTEGSAIDIRKEMNNTINKINGTDPHKDNLTGLLNDMVFRGTKLGINIFIPYLNTFDAQDLEKNPLLAPLFLEEDYPAYAFPAGPIRNGSPLAINVMRDRARSDPTWMIAAAIPSYCLVDGDGCNVVLTECVKLNEFCSTCPSIAINSNGIPIAPTGIDCEKMQADEFIICLKDDGCIRTALTTGTFAENYAVLSSLPNQFDYWRFETDANEANLLYGIKLDHAIIDKNYQGFLGIRKEGDILTLCSNVNRFNGSDSWDPTGGGGRFVIGAWGVFKIQRLNQLPLYFVFPDASGFWWEGGTNSDGSLTYGTQDLGGNCANGLRKIEEEYIYAEGVNSFTDHNAFGFSTEHIASTDFNFLKGYWGDNVITVGFSRILEKISINNLSEFSAPYFDNTISTTGLTKVGELELTSDGRYMTERRLTQPLSPNIRVVILVQAKFKNGKVISGTKEITMLDPDGRTDDFLFVKAYIRGHIRDYDSGNVNYLIQIYK